MMKKILIALLLLFTVKNYSQGITVDTNYRVDQLIQNILINSPCVTINNINFQTGTTFGSTNGIGYFENTNTNFPFSSGVVLTTGDVTKTPSPNTEILNDGNTAWVGDNDLETNLLSQSGIVINSINASFIEFDFQPKTSNFNFSFLFASEEYGTAQCSFSDAFAFLLKDVTAGGSNQNLAVIPSTNLPISVETIRDNTYNSKCPSVNPELFGSFNGTGFGPAINFNGQTVEMVASATGLDTNHTYHIKIVIADGGNDIGYDSAIFLKANSFNLGQNILGPDYTIENNSAICPGSLLPILSTGSLDPLTTIFEWKKEGVAFSPAETGSMLDLNRVAPSIAPGKHNFSVTYTTLGCLPITDEITIEIYPKIGALTTVPNIYTCESGALNYSFDLTKNTSIIMSGVNQATTTVGLLDDLPEDTIITYHSSETEAKNNINPLSTYTILSPEKSKTIWVRIQNPTSLCYEIRSFQLLIVQGPTIASTPNELKVCARNTTESPLKANFDLTANINRILGTQDPTYNLISFHTSLLGAQNNTNILFPNSSNIMLSPTRIIYVRLGNSSNSSCFATTSFKLTVIPIPEVDILQDVYVCDYYILPRLLKTGAQYWTGPNGTGNQHIAGDKILNSTTIYVFNQSTNGGCSNEDSFKVTIVNDLDSLTPKSETYCTEHRLPTLSYGKYFTKSGGTNTLGNIEIAPGTLITNTQTFYIWYVDTTKTPACETQKELKITIIPFEPLPNFEDKFDCNFYDLPILTSGEYRNAPSGGGTKILDGTRILSTQTIYVYKQSRTSPLNCTSEKQFTVFIGTASINPPIDKESCSSYTLPNLAFGEYRTAPAGGGDIVPEGTVLDETTKLWFYIPGQSCTDNMSFTISIKIKPLPLFEDSTHCDIYYLPAISHTGNYYTGPLGSGKLRKVGYPITSSQTLYFYDKATSGTCYVQAKFRITIYKSAPIDAKPREVNNPCGTTYMLDDLVNGEYYEFQGGPSPTNPVLPPGTVLTSSKTIWVYAAPALPNYCFSEYSIDIKITFVNKINDIYSCGSYTLPAIIGQGDYYSAPGGPHGIGTKISPPYTTPITESTTIYVYAEDNSRVSCYDEDAFNITIYNAPNIADIPPITTCNEYTLPNYTAPISKYFTKSGGPGNGNIERFPGELITSSTTIYAYAESGTPTTRICKDEKPMVITILPKTTPTLDVPPICTDFITGEITNSVIISGFGAPQYAVVWKKEDGTIVSREDNFSTNEAGNYTLNITDLFGSGCFNETVPFTVIKSPKPDLVNFTTSGWFTDSQTIVVNAVPSFGNGNNFLYSLDSNTPQTSNTFTNVSAGTHEIMISDANGCSSVLKITLKTIYAPKHFSPNGDGFNETWNIMGLINQDNPKLYIFDRYGKLLKQLQIDGPGWDGTYNGQPLPASDYWFTLTYQENGISKEYKSHFSLIR